MTTATTKEQQTPQYVSPKPGGIVMRARGLRKQFGGEVILDGLDLDLHMGEVVLLRGENGSGKTTLLNILTGNLEPDAGTIEVFANGRTERCLFPRPCWSYRNLFDHFTPERLSAEGIGRMWQDVRLFPTQTLCDNVAVARRDQPGENPLHALLKRRTVRISENENRRESENRLAHFGLGGRIDSSADMISLGQSKRVAIIRTLHADSKVIFLDEPLAGLDRDGATELMEIITRLARDGDKTVVIVEHAFNIPRLLQVVDRVWTLVDGALIDENPGDAQDADATRTVLRYQDLLIGAIGHVVDLIEQPLPGGASLTIIRPKSKASISRTPLLRVKDLVVERGRRTIFGWPGVEGLTFDLHNGEIGILQAPNGWGKTTLSLTLAGLIPTTRGTILIGDEAVSNLPASQRVNKGLLTYLGHDRHFNSLHVGEIMRLAQVKIQEKKLPVTVNRIYSSLSGGEKSQVALYAIIHRAYRVRILDEPFGSLSQLACEHLAKELFANISLGTAHLILEPAAHDFSSTTIAQRTHHHD